jgi:hypothetical protein
MLVTQEYARKAPADARMAQKMAVDEFVTCSYRARPFCRARHERQSPIVPFDGEGRVCSK